MKPKLVKVFQMQPIKIFVYAFVNAIIITAIIPF